ncbi:DEAD/DEAH box helicase [Schlesneria paludicola]|uniref:DEAD/DEAH box helicase n=1 Tax=Schlesneria paludicola TaxID=360056 RepID=UPI00058D296D|nr:DEAD/DEAH box helicase [Schlesneria paludicola]
MNELPPGHIAREDLALRYLDSLPYVPYPVQEEALLAWFETTQGVMVCAPTGTGKTLIAEAAAFEALHTGQTIYYTTPLIALTDQKFNELQDSAERWGFRRDQVGLVTGNRRVNPNANVLVVVAEILLNRLLTSHWAAQEEAEAARVRQVAADHLKSMSEQDHKGGLHSYNDLIGWDDEVVEELAEAEADPAHAKTPLALDFDRVAAVVMDEFHNFSDPERGIVWEFSLALLPKHIRLLLLSATIGNAATFRSWCYKTHDRLLELVQSTDRRIPLQFHWIGDQYLTDQLENMAAGEEADRKTPALVFCFNRDECWNVAEELKGKAMLASGQQKKLIAAIEKYEWNKGVGPKLKQLLMRGVGVHHAGLLPRYKKIVEELFQKKLLTICVCTETLAAGINLPARSVVLPSLMKGKPGDLKLIDPSSAHQIFGRAGRPQFDTEGHVFALAHEDDVRILNWREKYDSIPEDTKDFALLKAKKALKKKMPTRNPNRQYWTEQQFEKLRFAMPGDLMSRGPLPWRLLAYMLQLSPEVDRLRRLVQKRLMDPKQLDAGERHLEKMLMTLHAGDFVKLTPEPPPPPAVIKAGEAPPPPQPEDTPKSTWLSKQLQKEVDKKQEQKTGKKIDRAAEEREKNRYRAVLAEPTERLEQLFAFRSVNPVYGMFLLEHLGLADWTERMLIFESVLELPRALIRHVRVPPPFRLPPGPLAKERLDNEIVQRGLIAASDLYPEFDRDVPPEERKYAPALVEKLRMLFDSEYPDVNDVSVQPIMVATELLLNWNGNFFNFVSSRDLIRQEGLIFRHLLKMVLLLDEFRQIAPLGVDPLEWEADLQETADRLTECCRSVDPSWTDSMLAQQESADFVER